MQPVSIEPTEWGATVREGHSSQKGGTNIKGQPGRNEGGRQGENKLCAQGQQGECHNLGNKQHLIRVPRSQGIPKALISNRT